MVTPAGLALVGMRLVLFALALGMTVISYQAYRRRRTDRLQYAFIGFAFFSMGVGMTALLTQYGAVAVEFRIAQTVPFIVGFAMLYASMYR